MALGWGNGRRSGLLFHRMLFEELPDQIVGGNVLCGFSQEANRRLFPRPSVPATLDDDQNDFRPIPSVSVGPPLDGRVILGLVGQLHDLGLLITPVRLDPGLDRVLYGFEMVLQRRSVYRFRRGSSMLP